MQRYKITIDIDAAFGITRANPQFGQGGLPQVFVPDVAELIKQQYSTYKIEVIVMINIQTGVLKINNDLTFFPYFYYEDFKRTPYFKGQDGVRIIYLDEKQIIEGRTYIVSFFFREGKIYMVSLINCDDNISEDREKERKKIHDRILLQEGIESGKEYNWGKIESKYDVRSNVSSIDIFYNIS